MHLISQCYSYDIYIRLKSPFIGLRNKNHCTQAKTKWDRYYVEIVIVMVFICSSICARNSNFWVFRLMYDAKNSKNFWTFWPVIQVIDHLFFNPLSALLTYTHMSLCCHPLECCVDIYVYVVVLPVGKFA